MDTTKPRLLRQLGLLEKNDPRVPDIQNKLEGMSDIQADNWCHDIIVGNKTLDEALYGGVR